jgi:arginine/serine-rich splicing factor 17
LRFDGELDDRNKLKNVILRLDGRQIKLTGFTEYVKVRAVESKSEFPTRHDWDSFFRDAKNMDEMKAGERPDTVYLSNLPTRWVCPRHHENDDMVKPSESLFKRIFEKFGEVRCVDIPICDPYRDQMKGGLTGMKNFTFEEETYFEGYVQFTEYGSFVRCMDEFRGMKLVRKDSDKLVAVNILVHFDKTKHLTDASIKRRKVIREHLMEKDRQKAAEEEKKLAVEREKLEKIKAKEEVRRQIQLNRQKEREERRKQKNIQKISVSESSELTKKIQKEQKKLLKAQRKMESIRLLESLFSRIEKKKMDKDDSNGATSGFKGFDLRKKLKKKKSKKDKKDDDSISMSSVSSESESDKKKKKKRRDSSASSTSSSSSNGSRDRRPKPPIIPPNMTNSMFPTTGWIPTETGEWVPAPYMYAAPFFAPGMMAPRPYFNPNYRGGFRGRGRGIRGRYYDGGGGRYEMFCKTVAQEIKKRNLSRYGRDDYREHDYRRSRSRNRSYSRSRSRSRRRRRRSYTRR